MFGATSEMAVAMTVWSPIVKPWAAASSRPFARAWTMSTSEAIVRRSSSATSAALPRFGVEKRQALLEIEGGHDPFERQPQLDHGERYFRLDTHDHRLRTPEPGHVGDVPERAHGEGVHHVQRRDVDDDPAGAVLAYPRYDGLAQLREARIGERRLDRRDEIVSLLQDGDFHRASRAAASGRLRWRRRLGQRHDLVAEQALRFLHPSPQIPHPCHFPQFHPPATH